MRLLMCLILYLSCVLHLTMGAGHRSTPVKWTLYSDLWLTWNEAARFCREQGGHLPVTDTFLTFNTFGHWVGVWPDAIAKNNSNETTAILEKDMWTGLYKVNAGFSDTVYRWERGGSEFTLEDIPNSFWDSSKNEPNMIETQPCVRMDKTQLRIKTIQCKNIKKLLGRIRMVCEFYEECCTYNHHTDAAQTNTTMTSYPEVTSLEDCWALCEDNQGPGEECLEARWNTDKAVCPDTTPHSVSASVDGLKTEVKQLQHCFIGKESTTPSSYWYVNTKNKAVDIGPPTVAPQNFVCTLVFNGPGAETTLTETTPAESTLPETTKLDKILPNTTHSQTTLLKTTPSHTTMPTTTQSKTTQSETTLPDTTLTKTTLPDTTLTENTRPATLPDTTLIETTLPDTTLIETTLHDTALTETTLRDTALTQTTLRDTALTQTTLRDTALTETTLRDTALTETKLRDTALTETTLPDTTLTETTLPDNTLTETTLPDNTLTETTLPDNTLTETTLPDNTLTDATLPDTALTVTTLRDTALTETTLRDTALPETTLPDTTLTETTLPDNILTETTLPDNTLTDATLPDNTLTENTLPDNTLTDATLPDTGLTVTTLPDTALTVTTLPDTTLTETTMRDTALTETTLRDTTLTETTLPDNTLTETTLPDNTLTETTLPDNTLTDATLPDTALTETTLRDTFLTETTLPDTTLSETTLPDTTTGILSGNDFKSEALTHSEAMTTGVESESSTAADIPFETATTSMREENSSKNALLNSSDAQCYCRCPYQVPSNTSSSPTAHLHVVEKSSTSSFRRRRSSQWTSPSVTTIAISATMISSMTAFLAFFACCDLATLARYCTSRKTAAVKPEEA